MIKSKLIISLLGLLFFGNAVYSRGIDWEPSNKVFSIKEGLPSSETYFVHQDKQGYIWFCTDRGVVRYDGFHLQVFTQRNGLPDNVIFWIYEDYKGRIWFISYGGLLSYFENNKIVKYKYNHLIAGHIGNNLYPHKTFSVDKHDNVYFGSGNTGILKIDSKGKSKLFFYKNDYSTFDLVNGTYLSTINMQRTRLIYPDSYIMNIRKNGQPVKKVTSKTVFKSYMPNFISELKTVGEVEVARLQDCFFDLRFPNDVVRIPGATGYFPIGKDLWITTINGVYKLKDISRYGFTKAPRIVYLKGYRVSSVFMDKEKGLWFSTLDKGVIYVPNMVVKNVSIYDKREELDATHVVVNSKNEVIYSNHLGVFYLKGNVPIFLTNGMSRNAISTFSDILLISRNKRDFSIKGKNWLVFNYYDCFNEADTSALICYSRVARIHRNGQIDTLYDYFASKKYHKDLHHYFETVCSSDKGEVFAGNAKGLFCLKNGHWENSMFPAILRNNRVSHVRYSKELGLIVGTRGNGIIVFKNNRITHHITSEKGLISDQINRIAVGWDGKICWLTSNNGVSKLTFMDEGCVQIQNVLGVNGLLSNEVNNLFLTHKEVYLATKRGISKLPLDLSFLINPLKKQVTVKDVSVDGVSAELHADGLVLKSNSKMIHIELKSTNYKSFGNQKYKYRLSDKDKWTYGNSGNIDFYDLSSGEYKLELSYMSDNGIWQKPYGILHIEKQKRFVETFWFYILLVLMSFSGAFLLIRRRSIQLNKQRDYKRQIEKLEQKALLAQMNPHFIFNALNSIQSFLMYRENDLAERYLLKLSQLIRMTLNNSRESETSIEKEIEVLEKYLELEQMRYKNRFDFEFKNHLSGAEIRKCIPPMLIQPFVENSIIHGFKNLKEGGMITVQFSKIKDQFLFVEIIDNGLGYHNTIEKSMKEHKSYGTTITSERLNLFKQKYGGEFQYHIETITGTNGEAEGTIVKMIIPVI